MMDAAMQYHAALQAGLQTTDDTGAKTRYRGPLSEAMPVTLGKISQRMDVIEEY